MRVHGVFIPAATCPRLCVFDQARPGRVAVRLLSGKPAFQEASSRTATSSPYSSAVITWSAGRFPVAERASQVLTESLPGKRTALPPPSLLPTGQLEAEVRSLVRRHRELDQTNGLFSVKGSFTVTSAYYFNGYASGRPGYTTA
jgi:hypothetical protein